MKINLKFLLDFFTRFEKKKILIISIVLVALISILLASAIFLSIKSKRGEAEESKNHNEELSFDIDLYNPALDDATWVESVFARIEEERIAEELRVMEESLEEYQIDDASELIKDDEEESTMNSESESSEVSEMSDETNDSQAEETLSEIENFFSEEKEEVTKTGKNDLLSFYEFDNEIFTSQDSEGNHILVHSMKEKVNRFFYDDEYKLIKKEVWNIPSVFKAVLEKTETYKYFENSKVVSEKEITGPYTVENVKYSNDGKTLSAEKYAVFEDKEHITEKRLFSYDDDGNLLSDELKEYFYKADDYKNLDYSFTKKYLYSYNDEGIPPDFKYFENGILKMHNKYSTEKGNFTSRIFFDEGLSVKSYYENNIRVRDVYYRNNSIIREKVYEEPEKSEE
ncbi:MAG: hypothetical protein SPK26_10540 [Treponema sp.]|nr:hypothetical protein [Treponema sp.]